MNFGGDKSSNSETTPSEQHNVDGVNTMSKSMRKPQSHQESDSPNTAYQSQIGEVRLGGDRPSNSGTPLSDQQNEYSQNADTIKSSVRGRPSQENEDISLPFMGKGEEKGPSNGNKLSLPMRGGAGESQERVSSNPDKVSEIVFDPVKEVPLLKKGEVSFSKDGSSTKETDMKEGISPIINPEVNLNTEKLFGG